MAKEQETYTPRHCEGHDCHVEPNYGDWDVDLCALHASALTLLAQRDALLLAADAVISFIENENLAVTEDLTGEHLSGCQSAAYHLSQQTDDLPPIECLCGTTALRAAVQQAKGGVE